MSEVDGVYLDGANDEHMKQDCLVDYGRSGYRRAGVECILEESVEGQSHPRRMRSRCTGVKRSLEVEVLGSGRGEVRVD